MTASTNTPNDSSKLQVNDFNMKHRLTGAGILISLGVVILPWLLGSYSINADGELADQKNTSEEVEEVNGSEDNSIQINDDDEIQVFVSKIKPVDSEGRQIYQAQESSKKDKKASSAPKTDAKDVAKKEAKKSTTATAQVEEVKEKLKSNLDKKIGEKKPKETPKKVEKVAAQVEKKPAKPTPKKVETKAEPKKDVDQGYIISVGVYLKKDGAERVMADLKKKGFKPSSSESKSSKGLATRVWLGPFPTRAAAGKERSKLEQVIGEKGWIIRYP